MKRFEVMHFYVNVAAYFMVLSAQKNQINGKGGPQASFFPSGIFSEKIL